MAALRWLHRNGKRGRCEFIAHAECDGNPHCIGICRGCQRPTESIVCAVDVLWTIPVPRMLECFATALDRSSVIMVRATTDGLVGGEDDVAGPALALGGLLAGAKKADASRVEKADASRVACASRDDVAFEETTLQPGDALLVLLRREVDMYTLDLSSKSADSERLCRLSTPQIPAPARRC